MNLCMTFSEARDHVPGFKFLGPTKDGLWGKWVESNGQDWTEQQRQDWQREQAAIKEQRQQQESRQRSESLRAEERDYYYRLLLDQLSLHPQDQEDLHRRGLTDAQIAAAGIRSVEQWQPLQAGLPHTLSGVSLDARSLNTQPGYLCPMIDVDGRLVAFQIRLRNADGGGRYRWLSSKTKKRPNGPTAHMPNGENPLMVARPVDVVTSNTIGMCEGVLKPFIAAQKLRQVIIGAPGGQFAQSPQTLQHTLAAESAALKTKAIVFYPDAGSIADRGVLQRYRATWALIAGWGYTLTIGWWGQETKEASDVDEL